MDRRRFRSAIDDRDPHQQIFGIGFRVFDEDVEVAIAVEHAGVDQLELRIAAAAAPILLDERGVGEFRVRILVEHPHERVGRRRVEVEVVLLDVLAVVALVAREAEHPLLQDRIASIPQREREAHLLMTIADARDAVLIPPVRPRSRMIVRQIPHAAPSAL